MRRLVRWVSSVLVALFVGFSTALLVSPDPTGVTPLLLGGVLTVVLSVALAVGLRRATADEQAAA